MPVDEKQKAEVLPRKTIVGDRVRIRPDFVVQYQQLWPGVNQHTVLTIVGERTLNGRHTFRVDGDGPSEVFSGHVIRAWGNPNERYDGLRAAGVKLP